MPLSSRDAKLLLVCRLLALVAALLPRRRDAARL